jgi:hypothetical protein
MVVAGQRGDRPTSPRNTEDLPVMKTPSAKKWLGAVVAALTLTMVTSVAPASAATDTKDRPSITQRDSWWD